ncbi:type II 3-dehydroquinate dehydratase [Algibacter sp.]|nr:type II 3-dehydroquinate dehydratase [Algibacter sp.]
MSPFQILVLNGPNLNLLGTREPEVYGDSTLDDLVSDLRKRFPDIEIADVQSNDEGALIDAIQDFGSRFNGIVFNPGGYAHTSVAIRDAVSSISAPVIEVHISNIHAREEFRNISIVGGACKGVISGLGVSGYAVAIAHLTSL